MEFLKLSFPKLKDQIEMICISIFVLLAFWVYSVFQQILLNSSTKNSEPYLFFFFLFKAFLPIAIFAVPTCVT